MGKQHTYDWQFHIRQQAESGLSVKEYSHQQGFTAWSFYMNRKRLLSEPASLAANAQSAVSPPNSQDVNKSSFVQLGSLTSSNELTVSFSDGTTVHYRGAFSSNNLADLLCTLRHRFRSRR